MTRLNCGENPNSESSTKNAEDNEYHIFYFSDANRSVREADEREGIYYVCEENGYWHFVKIDKRKNIEVAEDAFATFNPSVYPANEQSNARSILGFVKKYCKRFDRILECEGNSLYLYSKTAGTGKTTLATIICKQVQCNGFNAVFYRVKELMDDLKRGCHAGAEQPEWQVLRKCKDTELLVLDDIGTEKMSDFVNDQMFDIVDHRSKYHYPTIYTSNLMPDKLPYMDQIRNRIESSIHLLEFPEYSIRKKVSATKKKNMMDVLMEE